MSDNAEILLPAASQRHSPNHDERPAGVTVDLLVIHNISLPPGEFGGPWLDDLFCNRLEPDAHPYFREIAELRVSTHLLIRRGGELIQYVPLQKRAWHAGASTFQGCKQCNDFSIGIELEGSDDSPYTQQQYHALAQAVSQIMATFPAITTDRIKGHSNIAPGRKSDPGPAFDWPHFFTLLKNLKIMSDY